MLNFFKKTVSLISLIGWVSFYVSAQPQKLPKGNSGMPYQLAGNLLISFPVHLQTSDYYRDLDLANATATVKYTSNGVKYKREFFTSLGENNVLMVRLTADKPKMITCKVKLQSPLTHEIKVDNCNLILSGKGSDHENRKGQIRYNIAARVKISQGASKVDTSGIAITCADTAVLYLSIATNFVNYHDISADPLQRASAMLNAAYQKRIRSIVELAY